MVSSLLQWLTERPSSPLPLPQGLQRTSRQAPAPICRQIDGAVPGNGAPLRSSSPVETISLHDADAPPQSPTFTPPQPSEPLSQSMDVDIPAQDTDRAPNQTNAPVTQSAAPHLPHPSGPQSTTAPTSAPPPPSPRRSDPSYADIVSGVSSTPSTTPNTAGLVDILERAQVALRAALQASSHLSLHQSSQSPWAELTTLASSSLREITAAQAGLAAAQALHQAAPQTRPPEPTQPPAAQKPNARTLTAWDAKRCIVIDPPDDKKRRAPTDISAMGTSLTAALRTRLDAPRGRLVEQLRRTAKGGYCAQISAPFSTQARTLTTLEITDQGTWSCTPLHQTRSPLNGGSTNSRPPTIRRDSFILSPVPDSLDGPAVLEAFSRDNAARLGLSPRTLSTRLTQATRLQRRLSRGPQAGSWVASRSIKVSGDPALVASIIATGHAVLDFHAVEVRPFSLPTQHCFHCGLAGHVARHCRGRCHRCSRSHPTQPCPLVRRAPDRTVRPEGAPSTGPSRATSQLRSRFPGPARSTRQTGGAPK